MVSGHLQQKKGNWYIILNLHDETGKRAPKWIATHLTVQGNKRRAEEMLPCRPDSSIRTSMVSQALPALFSQTICCNGLPG